jgi:FkbM family methyltransferase
VNVRRLAQRALRRAGYVIRRWPAPGSYEHALQRVLIARPVANVLDVGAHQGSYAQLLRSLDFRGRIDSFEPDPSTFDVLARRAEADGGWYAHAAALGSSSGVLQLATYTNTQLSSFHRPTRWAEEEWGLRPSGTIAVPVTTVDEFLASQAMDPGAMLLKVDTQGHDLAVLEGGRDSLREIAALQVEMPMVALYDGVPPFTDLLELIADFGLHLVGLFPVQRDPREQLIPIEYDGLFVRSDLPVNRRPTLREDIP